MAICRICGEKAGIELYKVKERHLNKGDVFEYLYCKKCNTLQLNEDVLDMGSYYGGGYYSYNLSGKRMKIPCFMVKPLLFFSAHSNLSSDIPRCISRMAYLSYSLYATGVQFNDNILDVGGGNGLLASFLKKNGYNNTMCIDKFCETSPFTNIEFKKCQIEDLSDNRKFDLIMFNSSFEHMPNPDEVLEKAKRILSSSGLILIKIPIVSCEAWNRFGTNWFQIDAPRHYFLFSPQSMDLLCNRHGLSIKKVMYYSGPWQLYISEKYQDSVMSFSDAIKAFSELSIFSKRKYMAEAQRLDKAQRGDVAWFYITKNESE